LSSKLHGININFTIDPGFPKLFGHGRNQASDLSNVAPPESRSLSQYRGRGAMAASREDPGISRI
jgi:hypothetical protein